MGVQRSRAPAADDYRDDDNFEDDEPRGRRRQRDDEDEPRERSRSRSRDEEDEPRARSSSRSRSRNDEDDEDRPRRSRRRSEENDDDNEPRAKVARGWGAARRQAAESSSFANDFRWQDEEVLSKFLEDEPFAVYKQHWIEREGKKGFVCPTSLDKTKKCALCKAGDVPRQCYAFNVAVIEADGGEVIADTKQLTAGIRLFKQIEQAHKGAKGPIDKNYWGLSKSGKKGGQVGYNLACYKERELGEDLDLNPDDVAAAVDKCKLYDSDVIKPASQSDLTSLAREFADDDD